ncbi:MAG: methyltransferase domain-containing protein [Halomonadaceae bacterium]|nr:MAG: methyltransferase domain-containing protein [Halomonadaceae bacterium]
MSDAYSRAEQVARNYYNSTDADTFYSQVWGGEDIHIGLYSSDQEPIFDASRRTVTHLGDLMEELGPQQRMLDLGAGYGGSARYFASTFGCSVVALNLSEVENARNREINRAHRLDSLIHVVDASYEHIPSEHGAFDVVYSQDAFLHSGNRPRVIREIARVLKPGGRLIFTDPMKTDRCPDAVLQPILDRLHLETLGSPAFYRQQCAANGLQEIGFEDHSQHLSLHYARVLEETWVKEPQLRKSVSEAYLEGMKKGLTHWVEGGRKGYLTWGIFRFQKPSEGSLNFQI